MSTIAVILSVVLLTGLISLWLLRRMEQRLTGMQADIQNAIRVAKQATGDE